MTARFAKLEVLSYYGSGGGLHYFNVKKSGKKEAFNKKNILAPIGAQEMLMFICMFDSSLSITLILHISRSEST